MKQFTLPVLILTGVIGLGVGFGGGYFFRNSQIASARANFTGQFQGRAGIGGTFRQGGRGFGEAVVGDIISQDANSITVKLADGSTKIVLLGSSTTYSNTQTASMSDLKQGLKVAVFGTANSDGSVTAQSVQLNPIMRGPVPTSTP